MATEKATPEPVKNSRIDLESAISDAARCASIAVTLMEDAMRPSSIHNQPNGYAVFMLTEDQWGDLSYMIGETAYRAKKVAETFDGKTI